MKIKLTKPSLNTNLNEKYPVGTVLDVLTVKKHRGFKCYCTNVKIGNDFMHVPEQFCEVVEE
jgi:acetolactate synthase regulatory subunit